MRRYSFTNDWPSLRRRSWLGSPGNKWCSNEGCRRQAYIEDVSWHQRNEDQCSSRPQHQQCSLTHLKYPYPNPNHNPTEKSATLNTNPAEKPKKFIDNKIDSFRTGEYSSASVLFVWEHSTHDQGNFPVQTGTTMVVRIIENVQCRVVFIQTDK